MTIYLFNSNNVSREKGFKHLLYGILRFSTMHLSHRFGHGQLY